jgi:hypothetical protein
LSKGVLGLLSLYPHSALLAHLPVPIWDAQVEMPLPVAWVIIVRVWLCTLLSIFYFICRSLHFPVGGLSLGSAAQ